MAHQQLAVHIPGSSDGGRMQEAVRIWLLGGFRLSIGARAIEAERWRLRKAANLVKLLALAPRHRLHREQVTDTLWPDFDAKSASNNLHRTLYAARDALTSATLNAASPELRLRGDLLELCPDGQLWVDVEVFEEAAANARRARDAAAYRAAVDLYAGELLPEDRYEEWAEYRREGLRRTYYSLLVEMARLLEEHEDYEPAIEALEMVVADDPANQDAHAGLMRLYGLVGRRNESLEREMDGHPTPRTGLISRVGNGLRGLVRPRSLKSKRVSIPPNPEPRSAVHHGPHAPDGLRHHRRPIAAVRRLGGSTEVTLS